MRVLIFLCLVAFVFADRYWDQPSSVRGGIHSSPVFRFAPTIQWNITLDSLPLHGGRIFLDNDERSLITLSNYNNTPSLFLLSMEGTVLSTKNIYTSRTAGGCFKATERNGVWYVWCNAADEDGNLIAIEKSTMNIRWNITIKDSKSAMGVPFEWSPDESFLLVPSVGRTTAVNVDGSIKWQAPYGGTGFRISESDSTIVFMPNFYSVGKLRLSDGSVVWSRGNITDPSFASGFPVIDSKGDVIATNIDTVLIKLARDTGDLIWTAPLSLSTAQIKIQPIALTDERILAFTTSGNMGYINGSSGAYTQLFENAFLAPGIGAQPFWNNDVLYVPYDNASLKAFDTSDPTTFTELWSVQLPFSRLQFTEGLAISRNGTIFLANPNFNEIPSFAAIGCASGQVIAKNGQSCVTCQAEPDNVSCQPVTAPTSTSPTSGPTSAPRTSSSAALFAAVNWLLISWFF